MIRTLILTLLFSVAVFAQGEAIDNRVIIEMSRSGLSVEIILKKISTSRTAFDVSATSLIELKKAGVDDQVIAAMMDSKEASLLRETSAGSVPSNSTEPPAAFSESGAPASVITPTDAAVNAKTIAFKKSSLQPSRQALEKELMKRKDFQQLNLTILRYKETADLFVDIGFVSGSWITHRYVYRVYDRRSGAVVAAGETTSWGSLAENLARHISKSLVAARLGKTT